METMQNHVGQAHLSELHRLEHAIRSLHEMFLNLNHALAGQGQELASLRAKVEESSQCSVLGQELASLRAKVEESSQCSVLGQELASLRAKVEDLSSNVGGFRRCGQTIVIDSCDLEVRDANLFVHTGSSDHHGVQGKGNLVIGKNHKISMATNGLVSGTSNTISGHAPTVLGGAANTAAADYSVVIGGKQNQAKGSLSVVNGGSGNCTEGSCSSVIGGKNNIARERHAVECSPKKLFTAASSVTSIGEICGRDDTFADSRLSTPRSPELQVSKENGVILEDYATNGTASVPADEDDVKNGTASVPAGEDGVNNGTASVPAEEDDIKNCTVSVPAEEDHVTSGTASDPAELEEKLPGCEDTSGGMEASGDAASSSGQLVFRWRVVLLFALALLFLLGFLRWVCLRKVPGESTDLSLDSAATVVDTANAGSSAEAECVSAVCAQPGPAEALSDKDPVAYSGFSNNVSVEQVAEGQSNVETAIQIGDAQAAIEEPAEQATEDQSNIEAAIQTGDAQAAIEEPAVQPAEDQANIEAAIQIRDAQAAIEEPAVQATESQTNIEATIQIGDAQVAIEESAAQAAEDQSNMEAASQIEDAQVSDATLVEGASAEQAAETHFVTPDGAQAGSAESDIGNAASLNLTASVSEEDEIDSTDSLNLTAPVSEEEKIDDTASLHLTASVSEEDSVDLPAQAQANTTTDAQAAGTVS